VSYWVKRSKTNGAVKYWIDNMLFMSAASNGTFWGFNGTMYTYPTTPHNYQTQHPLDGHTSWETAPMMLYMDSLNTNGMAVWLDDLKIYDRLPTPPNTTFSVALSTPQDSSSQKVPQVSFKYFPTSSWAITHANLYVLLGGSWSSVQQNQTVVSNNALNTITYTFALVGTYEWNVRLYNATASVFATANFTVTISELTYYDGSGWWRDWWG
jgi:hypothetical protein